MKKGRRSFLEVLSRASLTGVAMPFVAAPPPAQAQPSGPPEHFDLVVLGTGFGGTMTSLSLAYRMDDDTGFAAKPIRILLIERGTWWTTPLETVQDKNVATRDLLAERGQPFQEWSSLNDARGMVDLVRRCRRSEKRPQGLYDFTSLGKKRLGWLSGLMETTAHDGVSVLRASGVGGGSLVYSNITIRPPETLFDDPRWPGAWAGQAGGALRNDYYRKAADSISKGVDTQLGRSDPPVNTGLSNIVTRSARLNPEMDVVDDKLMPRTDGVRDHVQIRLKNPVTALGPSERELIDRARVFQTAISKLTPHYGAVDLAINDIRPEPQASDPKLRGKNYCERQGRCNIGCLPGARHTLNKQLMRALFGKFAADQFVPNTQMRFPCAIKRVSLELRALAEVRMISEAPGGGYVVSYRQHRVDDPTQSQEVRVRADRVIVAMGSLGSSELLLHCRLRAQETAGAEGLGELSGKLGFGFSTNGDHIAFLNETRERVSLTRGPVTTSVGQFNPDSDKASQFYQIEDQGIPRSLAALVGDGTKIAQALAQDDRSVVDLLPLLLEKLTKFFASETVFGFPRRTHPPATPLDMSGNRDEMEDELTAKMMCVVAQGKDAANGVFRVEAGDLRVARTDGKAFHEDPVYGRIQASLDKLAELLRPAGSTETFFSPVMKDNPVVLTSHPLGGCIMGATQAEGVVDEWGRVFRKSGGVYRGLYIADGSVIPTALGVNPSLTIAAVALRTADKALEEWKQIPASGDSLPPAKPCIV